MILNYSRNKMNSTVINLLFKKMLLNKKFAQVHEVLY